MQAREVIAAGSIREPVLRGRQSVAALWFPAAWFDETTRASRLIACWRPSASALRFAQGDLLCYATPIDEHCDDLPGWSLRQEGSALCSAPLTDAERAVIREGDVWIVLGAEVLTLHKRDAISLDPSAWLAIDHLSLHDTYDCSVALPAPVVLDLEPRPLREVLGNAVAPASRQQADFLAAMQRARREHPKRVSQSRRVSANSASRFIVGVVIAIAVITAVFIVSSDHFPWVFVIILLIRLAFIGLRGHRGTVSAKPLAVAPSSSNVPPRSTLAHPQRWRRWLARDLTAGTPSGSRASPASATCTRLLR